MQTQRDVVVDTAFDMVHNKKNPQLFNYSIYEVTSIPWVCSSIYLLLASVIFGHFYFLLLIEKLRASNIAYIYIAKCSYKLQFDYIHLENKIKNN